MRRYRHILSILGLFLFTSTAANAGIFELSYTYSTRSSFIDDDNFQKSTSHTGSFAWYFLEMSALELSYTKGEGEVSGKASDATFATKFITQLEIYDASLVLTLAQKSWAFQPYVKGGAAWVDKKIYIRDNVRTKLQSKTDSGEPVPSFGAGFRFFLTQNLNIKVSYDRWRSGKDASNDDIWDDAVRAGISLMF